MITADKNIFALLNQEYKRQRCGLELIASENYVSPQTLKLAGSIFTNKYAEGLPKKRYYGGCEVVDEIELLAIQRAKKLFNAEWANVQPHSGAQANASVMLALLNPGDCILGFDLAHGGHLSHGAKVNFSGKIYRAYTYGVAKENNHLIDYDQMEETTKQVKPKMIICGGSAYSRDWNYKRIRAIADNVEAMVVADIAHPSGLIAKGLLNHPFPHAHIITTTTHKTLRGPRGGMILIGKDMLYQRAGESKLKKLSTCLDHGVFPGIQGGPLMHIIAAKAVAFHEALSEEYHTYVKQVQTNARIMAESFIKRGYRIVSGGTDNHLLLIDLRKQNITGKEAEEVLGKASITINKNMVPFDEVSPNITSGIRIGTPAVTTRGLKENDMEQIVEYIDKILKNRKNKKISQQVKKSINNWMDNFPIFDSQTLPPLLDDLPEHNS